MWELGKNYARIIQELCKNYARKNQIRATHLRLYENRITDIFCQKNKAKHWSSAEKEKQT